MRSRSSTWYDPADTNETAYAWLNILERRDGPAGDRASAARTSRCSSEATSRASGEVFASAKNVAKGAYILAEAPNGEPDVILLSSGSEVQVAVDAREQLKAEGINARVVSVPCQEWFAEQSYRVPRVGAAGGREGARLRRRRASRSLTWKPFVGDAGTACPSSTTARPPTTRRCSVSSG